MVLNDNDGGKPQYSEINLPVASFTITNLTRTDINNTTVSTVYDTGNTLLLPQFF